MLLAMSLSPRRKESLTAQELEGKPEEDKNHSRMLSLPRLAERLRLLLVKFGPTCFCFSSEGGAAVWMRAI